MKEIYFVVGDDDYVIGGYSFNKIGGENVEKTRVEENHPIFSNDAEAFKFDSGVLVLDEERKNELEKEQNKVPKEEMNEMAILELAGILSNMTGGD